MTKKSITRYFILMLTLMLMLVSAIVAWFITYNHGSVDGVDMVSPPAISTHLNTSSAFYNGQSLEGYQAVLTPVSGIGTKDANGHVLLYAPVITPFTQGVPMSGTWQQVTTMGAVFDEDNHTALVSYIDYYAVIRATMGGKLALGGNSTVSPLSTAYTGESADKKSPYGDFSIDNIAGAVRVAFIVCVPTGDVSCDEILFNDFGDLYYVDSEGQDVMVPYTEQLGLIWIPNPNYSVSVTYDAHNLPTSATFTPSGTAEGTYSYYNGSSVVSYGAGVNYTSQLNHNNYFVITNSLWHNLGNDSYNVCVKIRIWIEGTDREANTVLSGGMFDTEIEFLTIQEGS